MSENDLFEWRPDGWQARSGLGVGMDASTPAATGTLLVGPFGA